MEIDEIIRALRVSSDPCYGCEDGGCSQCGYANYRKRASDLLESQQARITKLEALLLESQRRERAAVEDMKHSDNCDVCVGSGSEPDSCGCECMTCTLDCRCRDCRDESKFEWRGPHEAGEGETE